MRRRRRRPVAVEPQPDALPKKGLFAEPIRVADLRALDPEDLDDDVRVTFLIEVRDAEDRRCSDFSVEARVHSPERTALAQATTDMFGRLRLRITGPRGTYRIELSDVGAGGLAWDAEAGPRELTVDV